MIVLNMIYFNIHTIILEVLLKQINGPIVMFMG